MLGFREEASQTLMQALWAIQQDWEALRAGIAGSEAGLGARGYSWMQKLLLSSQLCPCCVRPWGRALGTQRLG